MPIGRLHVLTDYYFQQCYAHADLAARVMRGGADMVQFRQKTGAIRHVLHQARKTVAVGKQHNVPVLIDDHLDVALAAGAAGVHLGLNDFPIEAARSVLGPDLIIGATATTAQQAIEVYEAGADYIGFGPVFTTGSKRNPASVKGLVGLAEVCKAVPIPVIAIAGITPQRVHPVLDAGAHGVAVMTAISLASDPTEATAQFRSIIDEFRFSNVD